MTVFLSFLSTVLLGSQAYAQGADECVDATLITLGPDGTATVVVDTTSATTSLPDLLFPQDTSIFRDVWFRLQVPTQGDLVVSTCPGGGSTPGEQHFIAVYSGSVQACPGGAQIGWSSPACPGGGATTSPIPVAGIVPEYRIRVGSDTGGSIGQVTLHVAYYGSPSPDFQPVGCTTDANTQTATVALYPFGAVDDLQISVNGDLVLSTGPNPSLVQTFPVPTGESTIELVTLTNGVSSFPVSCDVYLVPPCLGGDQTLSPLAYTGSDQNVLFGCGSSIGNIEISAYRIFDLIGDYGVSDEIIATCLEIFLRNSDPGDGFSSQPMRVRLHSNPNGDAIVAADLQLIYEEEFRIPKITQGPGNDRVPLVFGSGIIDPDGLGLLPEPRILDLSTQPAGTTLVIELLVPNGELEGHRLVFGSPTEVGAAATPPAIGEAWVRCGGVGDPAPLSSQSTTNPLDYVFDLSYRSATSTPPDFVRGDVNVDGSIDLADPIRLLTALFPQLGTQPIVPDCRDAADANDDGTVDIADAIQILQFLFPAAGSPQSALAPPNVCGPDPTADFVGCAAFDGCP